MSTPFSFLRICLLFFRNIAEFVALAGIRLWEGEEEREKRRTTYAYHASVALHRISRRTRLARRLWNGNTHVTHKPYLSLFADGLVVSNLHILYDEMFRRASYLTLFRRGFRH